MARPQADVCFPQTRGNPTRNNRKMHTFKTLARLSDGQGVFHKAFALLLWAVIFSSFLLVLYPIYLTARCLRGFARRQGMLRDTEKDGRAYQKRWIEAQLPSEVSVLPA